MTRHLRVREFLLGVEGIALFRGLFSGADEDARQRVEEIRTLLESENDETLTIPTLEVGDGYGRWASTYDAPGNPLISAEQPAVWGLLERAAPGRALDAACGTGRHTQRLVELGHEVIGVDATASMLAAAERKVPGAEFMQADIRDLPLEADSFDLAVCALALEHLEHLGPPIAELARVLRPGGRLIITESHPTLRTIGGAPYFEDAAGASGVVRSYNHLHGDYLAAFAGAGLDVSACIEVPFGPEQVEMQEPAASFSRQATEAAFLGLPAVLIWNLTAAGAPLLDHVQVAAPPGCEPQARRFYGELLGLTELDKPDALRARGGVWFTLGRGQLHVGVQAEFVPADKAHPAFRLEPGQLDAIAERLRAAGAEVAWDESLPGERRFYTRDPWGNRIELLSRELPETSR